MGLKKGYYGINLEIQTCTCTEYDIRMCNTHTHTYIDSYVHACIHLVVDTWSLRAWSWVTIEQTFGAVTAVTPCEHQGFHKLGVVFEGTLLQIFCPNTRKAGLLT